MSRHNGAVHDITCDLDEDCTCAVSNRFDTMSDAPRKFAVHWDQVKKRLSLVIVDDATKEWVERVNREHYVFARTLDTLAWELTSNNPKFAMDPEPGDRPPSAGVLTPKLAAAIFQNRFAALFPLESFVVDVR